MAVTPTAYSPTNDGLDITCPDEITDAEISQFRAYYAKTKGAVIPGHEFWLEFRPDVLKRYRRSVQDTAGKVESHFRLPHTMSMLHHYFVTNYAYGLRYNLTQCQLRGATVSEVLDVFAIAYLHAGPQATQCLSENAPAILRNWAAPDPEQISRFPAGWDVDPGFLCSEMDFSTPDMSADDRTALMSWYLRTTGEIPAYVTFLAARRPRFLKAYRGRYENAIRGTLPRQMMPYLQLNHGLITGNTAAIRENVLLARAAGLTREQVVDCACWAFYHAGVEAIGLLHSMAGDVIETM